MIVLMVSVTWSNRSSPQGPVRRIRSTGPAGEVIFPFITSRECDFYMKLVYQSTTQFISYSKNILIATGKKRREMKMGKFCKGGKHLASCRNVHMRYFTIRFFRTTGAEEEGLVEVSPR